MTITIIDAQKKIRKLINDENLRMIFFCFFPLLKLFEGLINDDIYHITFIMGLILMFISVVFISVWTMRRKKLLKSINININTIADSISILTCYKKYGARVIYYLWLPLFLVGIYMTFWDDLYTDTEPLIIVLRVLFSLLFILPILIFYKNPVNRLIVDLNSLKEDK